MKPPRSAIASINRLIRELVALGGGILAGSIVFLAATWVGSWLRFDLGLFDWTMSIAVATAASLVAAFAFTWLFIRRWVALPACRRSFVAWFLVPYSITGAIGVPRILTDLASTEIAEYKHLKAENDRVWEVHPVIRFFVSFPLAPALVLTYHEYQLAGLYGEGVWELRVWYGTGSRSLLRFRTWIS